MWQTPTAGDSKDRDYTYPAGDHTQPFLALPGQASLWATPDANVFADGMDCTPEEWEARRARLKETAQNGNGCGTPLAMQAHLWSTPRATDGEKGGPNQSFGAGGVPLASQTVQCLSSLPVPTTATAGPPSSVSPPGSPRPRLNPAFVEWLMGWPTNWSCLGPTDYASWEMASSHWLERLLSASCGAD